MTQDPLPLRAESLLEILRQIKGPKAEAGVSATLLRREDLWLGRVAVDNGFVTEEQVTEALRVQRVLLERTGLRQRIGEVLYEMGAVDRGALDTILDLQQRKMRVSAMTVVEAEDLVGRDEHRLGRVLRDKRRSRPPSPVSPRSASTRATAGAWRGSGGSRSGSAPSGWPGTAP